MMKKLLVLALLAGSVSVQAETITARFVCGQGDELILSLPDSEEGITAIVNGIQYRYANSYVAKHSGLGDVMYEVATNDHHSTFIAVRSDNVAMVFEGRTEACEAVK